LRNRTHAVEIRRQLSEGWRLLCSTCYEEEKRAWEEKWQREKQAYEKRLRGAAGKAHPFKGGMKGGLSIEGQKGK
jgi:hypothetical protein